MEMDYLKIQVGGRSMKLTGRLDVGSYIKRVIKNDFWALAFKIA